MRYILISDTTGDEIESSDSMADLKATVEDMEAEYHDSFQDLFILDTQNDCTYVQQGGEWVKESD